MTPKLQRYLNYTMKGNDFQIPFKEMALLDVKLHDYQFLGKKHILTTEIYVYIIRNVNVYNFINVTL